MITCCLEYRNEKKKDTPWKQARVGDEYPPSNWIPPSWSAVKDDPLRREGIIFFYKSLNLISSFYGAEVLPIYVLHEGMVMVFKHHAQQNVLSTKTPFPNSHQGPTPYAGPMSN